LGTIVALLPDARSVVVRWDSGERDGNVPTGDGGIYRLCIPSPQKHHVESDGTARIVDNEVPSYVAPPPPKQVPERVHQPTVSPRVIQSQPVQQSKAHPRAMSPPPNAPPNGGRGVLDLDFNAHLNRISTVSTAPEAEYLPREAGYTNGQGPALPTGSKQAAVVSRGKTTVGLSVYGNKVDYVVPGGPAHLSRQLASEDEILEVDGKGVEAQDVPSAIVGGDVVNSSVKLLVRKADTGREVQVRVHPPPQRDPAQTSSMYLAVHFCVHARAIVYNMRYGAQVIVCILQVEIARVPKHTMENMVRLFELLTQLKQNGHNNAEYEVSYLGPQSQMSTMIIVDKVRPTCPLRRGLHRFSEPSNPVCLYSFCRPRQSEVRPSRRY